MTNDLLWLQEWFRLHCDKDWEHLGGIQLGTLDNPGWALDVDLSGIDPENQEFNTIDIEKTEDNWLYCAVRDEKFLGRCGPNNLLDMIRIFRDWVDKGSK